MALATQPCPVKPWYSGPAQGKREAGRCQMGEACGRCHGDCSCPDRLLGLPHTRPGGTSAFSRRVSLGGRQEAPHRYFEAEKGQRSEFPSMGHRLLGKIGFGKNILLQAKLERG